MGLKKGIIFQETDQLVENVSLDLGNWDLTLKNVKSANLKLPPTQFNSQKGVNLSSFSNSRIERNCGSLVSIGTINFLLRSI